MEYRRYRIIVEGVGRIPSSSDGTCSPKEPNDPNSAKISLECEGDFALHLEEFDEEEGKYIRMVTKEPVKYLEMSATYYTDNLCCDLPNVLTPE